MGSPIKRIFGPVDRWLAVPEPNAAGRLGLFRILFVLFYFWSLHDYHTAMLYGVPERFRQTVLINGWKFFDPPLWYFDWLGPALIASLVLLLFGLWTRLATGLVLVLGGLVEAYFTSIALESGTVFLKAFIPLFMFLGGDWGATYSLDALRRKQAGLETVRPGDSSVAFALPIRAVLAVLSIMFLTGAVWKSLPGSPWFSQDNVFGNLMTTRRIWAAKQGLAMNPLAELFVTYPALEMGMRVFVIFFEGLFFLAMFNRRLRSIFVATALMFHSINAIWMYVTFSPIMIVYGLFIDWEAIRVRVAGWLGPMSSGWARLYSVMGSPAAAWGVVVLALGAGLVWHESRILHAAFSLDGHLNWHTMWYPVLPLSVGWLAWCAWCVGRGGLRPKNAAD